MGRPLGALRGRTDQANELATWLRKVTLGKAVRKLEEDFSYSTTSWSEYRSGSRLPPEKLLRAVVELYIREPKMRERQLAEGVRLLEAARRAEAAADDKGVPPALPVPALPRRGNDLVSEALLRLDDARLRQIEALQKLAASERRRLQLEDMVSVLQERCTLLEGERDRARADARAVLERELEMSREYRRQADEKLEHARRAEEKAYRLRLAAEQQVSRQRIALSRSGQTEATGAAESPSAGPQSMGRPSLDEIFNVLRVAQEQLDAQDDELDDLEVLIERDADEDATSKPASALLIVPEQPVNTFTPGQSGIPEPPVNREHGNPPVGEHSDGQWWYALEADREWKDAFEAAKEDLMRGRVIAHGVLTRFEAVLGPDHEMILHIRGVLAGWLGLSGGAAGAATAYAELLADRLRIQGPDHPATIATRGQIAHWRREAGDAAGAVTAYAELLADRLRIQGPDHPATIAARFPLAYARGENGDRAGAAQDLADIVADQSRVLGPDDLDVLASRRSVATWRGRNGDPVGAARAFAELLVDSRRVLGPDDTETRLTHYQYKYWRGQARWWRRLRHAARPAR
ncbi:hypothetical protein ACF1G0_32565 [Streptomyces sp. NPDC013953]|uniref:hypothetical protein n=1 Tax=Streptomyces sp. NPDC013953 TaxID=3364868 RepID=UPI003700AE61